MSSADTRTQGLKTVNTKAHHRTQSSLCLHTWWQLIMLHDLWFYLCLPLVCQNLWDNFNKLTINTCEQLTTKFMQHWDRCIHNQLLPLTSRTKTPFCITYFFIIYSSSIVEKLGFKFCKIHFLCLLMFATKCQALKLFIL